MVVDQEKIAHEEIEEKEEKDEQAEVAKDPQPAASPAVTHQQENVAMQTEQPAAASVTAALIGLLGCRLATVLFPGH